jgi:hypothetical protein
LRQRLDACSVEGEGESPSSARAVFLPSQSFFLLAHGLRRGLHSDAASRLVVGKPPYAALKRRSSTAVSAFGTTERRALPGLALLAASGGRRQDQRRDRDQRHNQRTGVSALLGRNQRQLQERRCGRLCSHFSQRTREMGHPCPMRCKGGQDQRQRQRAERPL